MGLMNFKIQYKGKMVEKVPKSKLILNGWFLGIKYDGNYVQIHKKENVVKIFTSGGSEVKVYEIINDLLKIPYDFIVEAEFLNNCDGKTLNDRTKCSLGTARADMKYKVMTSYPNCSIKVFDVLELYDYSGNVIIDSDTTFSTRRLMLEKFNVGVISSVDFTGTYTLITARSIAKELTKQGMEGAFCFHKDHKVMTKGRSNLAIKIKNRNMRKMVCLGAKASETVDNEFGALQLSYEGELIQPFGGLTKKIRTSKLDELVGKIFLVTYENIIDGKYIQGFVTGEVDA